MAGGIVTEKQKRVLQENKKDCSIEQSLINLNIVFLTF